MSDITVPPRDLGPAIIRTIVPYVTVFLVAWLAERGVDTDSTQVSALVITVGGSLWYTFVRFLEQRWPKAGWLLGSPTAPTYQEGV